MDSQVLKTKGWFYKEKFTFLLVSLLFYAIIAPFFISFLHADLLARIFFFIILVSAVLAVSSKKEHLILILIISGLRIAFFCYTLFVSSDNILMLDMILQSIYFIFLIFMIGGYFYKDDSVSRNTISAALICYILLVLLWSNLYFLIELKFPNSFTISHEAIKASPSILSYFSFVTITTLGYGDISPVSPQARNLAVFEAFVGQMYVAVLIARLVAIHTAQVSAKKRN